MRHVPPSVKSEMPTVATTSLVRLVTTSKFHPKRNESGRCEVDISDNVGWGLGGGGVESHGLTEGDGRCHFLALKKERRKHVFYVVLLASRPPLLLARIGKLHRVRKD